MNSINTETTEITNINQQISEINNTLKGLIEVNQTLIKQNLKLSEELYGKVKLPENSEKKECEEKDLFYSVFNSTHYIIHGNGTYDNRDKIKNFAVSEWDKELKHWKVKTSLDKLIESFPNIKEKELFSF